MMLGNEIGVQQDSESPATAERLPPPTVAELRAKLEELYRKANEIVEESSYEDSMGDLSDVDRVVKRLGSIKHASRGALLTLLLYKSCRPDQDVRNSKVEHPGGFSARSVDTVVTVPFLLKESLPRNVETHWLSQTLSFAEPWTRQVELKTQPRDAGPLLIEAVNALEEAPGDKQQALANRLATVLMCELIQVRNRGKVHLTRPKNLTIAKLLTLLNGHFTKSYKSGAPRLPQLAVYATYECLFRSGVGRYRDWHLDPLRRMKAADRKAGTVGDIVVSDSGRPVEAVETKLGLPVTVAVVAEAMEKIRTATVERYLILSTSGVLEGDRREIEQRCLDFRRSNGCEVIVNGVLETVGYYLRLLPTTTDFVDAYAALVENDDDLDYEHRVAWNSLCEGLSDDGS